MSHSPEPWKFDATLRGIMASDESAVCYDIPEDDDDDAGTILAPNKVNAERIVACVNFCRGIPTEELVKHSEPIPDSECFGDIHPATGWAMGLAIYASKENDLGISEYAALCLAAEMARVRYKEPT